MMHEPDAAPRGLICPRCGCRHFNVTHTERIAGRIRRRRVCRHCGRKIVTLETPLGEVRDEKKARP